MDKILESILERIMSDISVLAACQADMREKINIAQTGVDGLTEMLHETCFETIEERMDNKLEALEKRLNDTRKEMNMKPDYQDMSHRIREHLGEPTTKPEFYKLPEVLTGFSNLGFTIEQKKHICSAIDKWYGTCEELRSRDSREDLKRMICDTKVGEFIEIKKDPYDELYRKMKIEEEIDG